MWRLRNRYVLLSQAIGRSSCSANETVKCGMLQMKGNKGSSFGPCRIRAFCQSKSLNDGRTEKKNFIPIDIYLKAPILAASVSRDKTGLSLTFDAVGQLNFPLVWLRDNCRCLHCFDEISQSRIHDQQLLRSDVQPNGISCTEKNVTVEWDDGHKSEFSKEWLCRHSFQEGHQRERSNRELSERVNWTSSDFREKVKPGCYQFHDVLNDDGVLLQWLLQLTKYGVAVLRGTPSSSGQLERIARRIAFIRKTHYGEEFMVKGSDDANNVAYKKGALQLHTDLPYYNYVPGIVMLHCITQSSQGGENILCDGLNAVSQLSHEMFHVLSQTAVDWTDIGSHDNKRFHSVNREPVLCLNSFGLVEKINWSQPQRGSMFNVTPQRLLEWYNAAVEFTRIIHHETNAVIFKSQPGDILSFDNRRILHGRKNYADAERLLYGAYIDWDEIYSRIRVLQSELR